MKVLLVILLCLTIACEAYKHKKAYHQKLKNHKKMMMNDKNLHLISNRVLHKHDNNGKKHKFGHWGEHWAPTYKTRNFGHKGEHWAPVKPKHHKSWANTDMHLQDLAYLEKQPLSHLSTAPAPTQAAHSTHKSKVHHPTRTPAKHRVYKPSKISKKHYKKKYGKKKASYKKY